MTRSDFSEIPASCNPCIYQCCEVVGPARLHASGALCFFASLFSLRASRGAVELECWLAPSLASRSFGPNLRLSSRVRSLRTRVSSRATSGLTLSETRLSPSFLNSGRRDCTPPARSASSLRFFLFALRAGQSNRSHLARRDTPTFRFRVFSEFLNNSGRRDSNSRPLEPHFSVDDF